MKLSNHDIDTIADIIQAINSQVKALGLWGSARDAELITEVKRILKHKQSGIRENVCLHCLGTGYAEEVRE